MSNRTNLGLTILSKTTPLLALAVLMSLTACGGSKWQEVRGAPNTGDAFAEKQTAPVPPQPMRTGDPGFISTEHLPAKESDDQPVEDQPILERNDKVEVTNAEPGNADGSLEAVIVDSKVPENKGRKVIIPKKYVAAKPVVPTNEENAADKYFVVQNIATEKLRVYENCTLTGAVGCAHKMIFETDMAAGRDTKAGRSLVGAFRITQWFKFYEDTDHLYPSFSAVGSPKLPAPGAGLDQWLSKSLLPKGSKGVSRGAFGWYTAYLGPNANEQWTHGTLGWGEDGLKFIDAAKDPSNLGKFERSAGCTRVENSVIALMREILPVGTKIFKIYAKEGLADSKLTRYANIKSGQWDYILTRSGTMSTDMKSGAKHAASGADVLAKGSYILDQKPDAVPLIATSNGKNEENGNVYNVAPTSMKGVFLIDEGRLSGYSHPAGLGIGGTPDHKLPSLVISSRTKASAVKPPAADPQLDSFD